MLEPDPAPGTRPLDGQFYPLVVEDPGHFSVLGLPWLPLGATWARFFFWGGVGLDVGGIW